MIYVALVSAYPTEADARSGIAAEDGTAPEAAYLGVWRLPEPLGTVVHLFGDHPVEELTEVGFTPVETGRYPAGGCVLRDKANCKLPYVTCCDQGRAQRWWPAVEWPDDSDLQETHLGSGIYE